MNLELDIVDIKDVQFGNKTGVKDRVLYINRKELEELIARDKSFTRVNVELAHPGENCRIANVHTITEPRAKMDGTGSNFPGILGELQSAGEGRTRALKGTTIVTIDHQIGYWGAVIDMFGPGAQMGLYGNMQNIVLDCHPIEDIDHLDLQNALTLAAAKTSVYLAESSFGVKADRVEEYKLGPLADVGKGMENLPRVAYIYQIHYLQHNVMPKSWVFYGDPASKLMPTIVHPNEILDGAVVQGIKYWGQSIHSVQNHPVIKELYKRHGKDLCFVGVVVMIATPISPDNKRNAIMAAKLAKWVLKADGVILTKIGGGAPHVDLGLTTEACENIGMRTTVICHDMSPDGKSEGALLFSTPGAQAIVNVGVFDVPLILPPVKRLIGGPASTWGERPGEGELKIPPYILCGAIEVIGAAKMTSVEV